MNPKYLGRNVALPKAAAERLQAKRAWLATHLGFEPSLSDTIGWLVAEHDKLMASQTMPSTADTPSVLLAQSKS